jgi:hypothetical protein
MMKELDRSLWKNDHAPGKHIQQFTVARMTESLDVVLRNVKCLHKGPREESCHGIIFV